MRILSPTQFQSIGGYRINITRIHNHNLIRSYSLNHVIYKLHLSFFIHFSAFFNYLYLLMASCSIAAVVISCTHLFLLCPNPHIQLTSKQSRAEHIFAKIKEKKLHLKFIILLFFHKIYDCKVITLISIVYI